MGALLQLTPGVVLCNAECYLRDCQSAVTCSSAGQALVVACCQDRASQSPKPSALQSLASACSCTKHLSRSAHRSVIIRRQCRTCSCSQRYQRHPSSCTACLLASCHDLRQHAAGRCVQQRHKRGCVLHVQDASSTTPVPKPGAAVERQIQHQGPPLL